MDCSLLYTKVGIYQYRGNYGMCVQLQETILFDTRDSEITNIL